MFQQTQKCPQCGEEMPKEASFCSRCGKPLAGGKRRCGACGTENQGDAKFCRQCGASLSRDAAPQVMEHRWSRRDDEFAVRVEANDLPGLLKRGIKVEPGTNGMIVYRGVNMGVMPPGEYTLSTIGQRIADWMTGNIPERATALLVDVTPAEMEFNLGGRFTSDPLPIGLTVRLQAEIGDPGKFLINVLKGNERFSKETLRQYLYPEIVQTADRWLRSHTLKELVEDASQVAKLELNLEEALRTTFTQTGLHFLQVRTTELNLEPFELIKGKYARANLLDADMAADLRKSEVELRAEEQRIKQGGEAGLRLDQLKADFELRTAAAEVDRKKRYAGLAQETDLLELAAETRKVEMEERKAELYQRMRQAVLSDKMKEVRSAADFEVFMSQIDTEKLLREKERADLLKTWKEQEADHDKARAYMAAKLGVEQEYELRLASLKLQKEVDTGKLEAEQQLARTRADFDFEMRHRTAEEELRLEEQKWELQFKRQRAQMEFDDLQRRQNLAGEREEAQLGLEILAKMKEVRRLDEEERLRIQRVDKLERDREQWKIEAERLEMQERHRQAERGHELAYMQQLGQLGAEALISLSGPEQAQMLADLKRTETLKGMTEEQILALAAERSPEVARAIAEKYRAIAEGKANEREQQMYERLLSEQKNLMEQLRAETDRRAREQNDIWNQAMMRSMQTSEHAMDRMADTAQAFARGQSGQPVIVVPAGGGPQVVYPGGGVGQPGAATVKTCPTCGRVVEAEAHHCQYCGHKFEGVS